MGLGSWIVEFMFLIIIGLIYILYKFLLEIVKMFKYLKIIFNYVCFKEILNIFYIKKEYKK